MEKKIENLKLFQRIAISRNLLEKSVSFEKCSDNLLINQML